MTKPWKVGVAAAVVAVAVPHGGILGENREAIPDYSRKTYIAEGEIKTVAVGYSEAAMFLGVSGTMTYVELLPTGTGHVAQFWQGGRPFSFPVSTGEAGLYRDDNGYYFYPPVVGYGTNPRKD